MSKMSGNMPEMTKVPILINLHSEQVNQIPKIRKNEKSKNKIYAS